MANGRLPAGSLLLTAGIRNPAAPGRMVTARLRIDTGATVALLDPHILTALTVPPIGHRLLQGVTGVAQSAALYRVDLDLQQGGTLPGVVVAGMALPPEAGADGLFGDNLLQLGVLVYNGPANTWSFQVTPLGG